MPTCRKETNAAACACSAESCSKRGVCCECITYHRRLGELPGCLFPPDVERTWDRSIDTFIRTYQERGPWW